MLIVIQYIVTNVIYICIYLFTYLNPFFIGTQPSATRMGYALDNDLCDGPVLLVIGHWVSHDPLSPPGHWTVKLRLVLECLKYKKAVEAAVESHSCESRLIGENRRELGITPEPVSGLLHHNPYSLNL